MSSFFRMYKVVKAALFTLFVSLLCLSLPARAADQLADFNKTLSNAGIDVLFWVFVLFVVITVCAFHDGNSRDSENDDSRDFRNKRPD